MGNVADGVSPVTEGVDGRDNVSDNDNDVSGEVPMGSFRRLGSPRGNVKVIQWGSLFDEVGN